MEIREEIRLAEPQTKAGSKKAKQVKQTGNSRARDVVSAVA